MFLNTLYKIITYIKPEIDTKDRDYINDSIIWICKRCKESTDILSRNKQQVFSLEELFVLRV